MRIKKILVLVLLITMVLVGCSKHKKDNQVMGKVINFNEQGMQIEKGERWEDQEGSYTATSGEENSETMNIFFNEETIFEIHEITLVNGQEEVAVSQGHVRDLALPGSVEVSFYSEGDKFVAEKVEIWTLSN